MMELGNWRHICVDAQRMFAEDTPWYVPWMARVLPQLLEVSGRHAERTIFTRFIPPKRPDDVVGAGRTTIRNGG
ncbi:nicotinamidase-related amidase [Rhizobium sp. OAE497]